MVEELCWDFVHLVMRARCNFSSFCQFVEANYKRNGSRPFVTSRTFSKLFFSWASNQQREFRRVCQWCGSSPKVLACDGTKIGILHHNISIDAIESVDPGLSAIPTTTRRFDRCFLFASKKTDSETAAQQKQKLEHVKKARSYLKDITSSAPLNLSVLEHESQRRNLQEVFPQKAKPILERFLFQQMTTPQLLATKRLLHLLSFDASVRAFLPTALLPAVSKLMTTSLDEDVFFDVLSECSKYNVALGDFLSSFFENGLDQDAISLVDHLVEHLASITESTVTDYPTAEELPNSYNPSKSGRFYYFNESGAQLRKTRQFSIDLENKNKNATHDDAPNTSSCSKHR